MPSGTSLQPAVDDRLLATLEDADALLSDALSCLERIRHATAPGSRPVAELGELCGALREVLRDLERAAPWGTGQRSDDVTGRHSDDVCVLDDGLPLPPRLGWFG